jgi:hypothetical protein
MSRLEVAIGLCRREAERNPESYRVGDPLSGENLGRWRARFPHIEFPDEWLEIWKVCDGMSLGESKICGRMCGDAFEVFAIEGTEPAWVWADLKIVESAFSWLVIGDDGANGDLVLDIQKSCIRLMVRDFVAESEVFARSVDEFADKVIFELKLRHK